MFFWVIVVNWVQNALNVGFFVGCTYCENSSIAFPSRSHKMQPISIVYISSKDGLSPSIQHVASRSQTIIEVISISTSQSFVPSRLKHLSIRSLFEDHHNLAELMFDVRFFQGVCLLVLMVK